MKYLRIDKPGKAKIYEDNEKLQRGKDQAVIKLLYGGVCGSDLGTYRGTYAYVDTSRIPGHEVAAEIIDIGDNNFGLKKGMIVTINPYFNCGECYSCRRGLVNCCTDNQTLGCQRDGAFREYFVIDNDRIYDGQGISPKELVLVEPFCISYHGVKKAEIKQGQRVLILGAGAIGVFAALSAKHFGAEVYLSDISLDKLKYAQENFDIDGVILNSSKEDFDKAVNRITDGDLFDVTIEAVGLPSTFQNCIDSVCFGGKVIIIGISKQSLDFDYNVIQKKELNIHGSRNATKEDFMEVIDIVKSGKFDISKIITNVYNFEDASKALDEFDKNASSMLKVVFKF